MTERRRSVRSGVITVASCGNLTSDSVKASFTDSHSSGPERRNVASWKNHTEPPPPPPAAPPSGFFSSFILKINLQNQTNRTNRTHLDVTRRSCFQNAAMIKPIHANSSLFSLWSAELLLRQEELVSHHVSLQWIRLRFYYHKGNSVQIITETGSTFLATLETVSVKFGQMYLDFFTETQRISRVLKNL